jgi:hypothetical protein
VRDVHETSTATVAGDGSATVNIAGPHRTGTRWELRTVVVASTRASTGGYPTAAVYRGAAVPSLLLGESRTADKVTFDATTDVLFPGDTLLVVLADAEPGSTAVVNLYARELP